MKSKRRFLISLKFILVLTLILSIQSIRAQDKENNWCENTLTKFFGSKLSKKGYYCKIEQGILANSEGYSQSFQMTNGYLFKYGIAVGAGIGLEYMKFPATPLYLDLRYEILKREISPFINLNGGYSFAIKTQEELDPYYYYYYYADPVGGYFYNIGIGIRAYVSNRTALIISAGYREQKMVSKLSNYYWLNGERELIDEIKRIYLGFGIMFK